MFSEGNGVAVPRGSMGHASASDLSLASGGRRELWPPARGGTPHNDTRVFPEAFPPPPPTLGSCARDLEQNGAGGAHLEPWDREGWGAGRAPGSLKSSGYFSNIGGDSLKSKVSFSKLCSPCNVTLSTSP